MARSIHLHTPPNPTCSPCYDHEWSKADFKPDLSPPPLQPHSINFQMYTVTLFCDWINWNWPIYNLVEKTLDSFRWLLSLLGHTGRVNGAVYAHSVRRPFSVANRKQNVRCTERSPGLWEINSSVQMKHCCKIKLPTLWEIYLVVSFCLPDIQLDRRDYILPKLITTAERQVFPIFSGAIVLQTTRHLA